LAITSYDVHITSSLKKNRKKQQVDTFRNFTQHN